MQICQLARESGLLKLEELGYDGTRVRANNRRSGTRTPEELRQERAELQKRFDESSETGEMRKTRGMRSSLACETRTICRRNCVTPGVAARNLTRR